MMDETPVADDMVPAGAAPLGRRLAAEFVGTLLFVAVGTGTATVLALGPLLNVGGLEEVIGGVPQQTQIFTALLGNSLADILALAFAFATALAVLVYAFGGISGAHFNPAVTFALAVSRRFRWAEVLPYWIVQCLGGIAGAFVVAGIYGQNGASIGNTDLLFGAPQVAANLGELRDYAQPVLAEAFIAFILVTAIMAVAIDPRAPKGWSGLIIGLALAGGILVTSSATGGSANFARSLGPLVASLLYDTANDLPWSDLLVYAAGPLIGGSAAALVYESVTGLERVSPAPSPGAATPPETEAEPTPPLPGSDEPVAAAPSYPPPEPEPRSVYPPPGTEPPPTYPPRGPENP